MLKNSGTGTYYTGILTWSPRYNQNRIAQKLQCSSSETSSDTRTPHSITLWLHFTGRLQIPHENLIGPVFIILQSPAIIKKRIKSFLDEDIEIYLAFSNCFFFYDNFIAIRCRLCSSSDIFSTSIAVNAA